MKLRYNAEQDTSSFWVLAYNVTYPRYFVEPQSNAVSLTTCVHCRNTKAVNDSLRHCKTLKSHKT